MTYGAMTATLPVNVRGLQVMPLGPAIVTAASALRSAGANLVIVAAHAGGRCSRFDDPADLSSCDATAEIFQVASSLPPGLVDVIAAGHTHNALSHKVGGIAIIQAFARGQAFGRVDVTVDRRTMRIADVRLFAPRDLCARQNAVGGSCDPGGDSTTPLPDLEYEGRAIGPDAAIVRAMAPVMRRVRALQAVPLGVSLDTGIGRTGHLESPLGNLFADALLDSFPGADVAINNNAIGGLRADLPPGPLTFGRLYDVFPFDNRLVQVAVTGAELTQIIASEIRRGRRGALGIAGLRIRARCDEKGLNVDLRRASGGSVAGTDRLFVVAMDSLAAGSVFAPLAGSERFAVSAGAPVLREVVEDWFRRRGGRLRAEQFVDADHPRWEYPDALSSRCIEP
jgi:5'-nucleotidase